MTRHAATPESEKEKRRKWILLITLLLSFAVMVTSLFFLAKIRGWRVRRNDKTLLTIVNAETLAPADSAQTLTFIDDTHMVDARCAYELEQMLADCRAAGHDPCVLAAYRSESEQRELLNAMTEDYMADGSPLEEARRRAAEEVEQPGHSEHQLGLAVDIGGNTDETGTQRWLEEHAWEYGFILRYPAGGEGLTGGGCGENHFRYVGLDAAKQIRELGITLEEYVSMFYSN